MNMNRLELAKVNVGAHADEIVYLEMAKRMHDAQIEQTETHITVSKGDKILFDSDVTLFESGELSITHKGYWKDGKPLRIVNLGNTTHKLAALMGKPEIITFGSMYSDGYAVTFELR